MLGVCLIFAVSSVLVGAFIVGCGVAAAAGEAAADLVLSVGFGEGVVPFFLPGVVLLSLTFFAGFFFLGGIVMVNKKGSRCWCQADKCSWQ